MGFLSNIFGTDFETQKRVAFEKIELEFQSDIGRVNLAKAGRLTMRGNDLSVRHNFDQAIKDLTEAIKFDAKHVSAYVSLGGAYSTKKMFKEAIAVLENAENLLEFVDNAMRNLVSHNLYNALGSAYFFTDNKEKAVQHLTKSLEAFEKQRTLKETGVISEEQWKEEQKVIAPMVQNTKWLLARIKL